MPQDMKVLAPAYLAAHLLLDWISFIHAVSPLNITPWNPPAGLIMGLLIIAGRRAVPLVWLGLALADVVMRGPPAGLAVTLLSDAVIAGGYAVTAGLLRRLALRPDLARLRDVVLLLAAAAVAPLAIGASYIALYTVVGLFAWSGFTDMLMRYWVGEVIGIAVLTPFMLVMLRRPWRRLSARGVAESIAQGMTIAFALWLDFGPLATAQYEYFYILFLPAVWVAVRHGLAGATVAVMMTQAGLVAAIEWTGIETMRMTHFQLLMLTLAVTALMVGAVVSERRRVEAWMRERQADVAHASRLAEAGEMAAALAHELNQPLTASRSYARAARKIAEREAGSERLLEILDKAIAQADRADRVIRSLREFVRKSPDRAGPLVAADLVADCLVLAEPLGRQHDVSIRAEVTPALPRIHGNAVQLQQVLLNLVRNAAEAMSGSGSPTRRIVVFAEPASPGLIRMGVRDTGPGLAGIVERNLFVPFVTTKATGMGLGLSIARTIVEAHGGTLTGHRLSQKETAFEFTIPVAADGTTEPDTHGA